jgi:YfiH family protein
MMKWTMTQGVHAMCTTREGGVSLPPYDSFNLGTHVGDDVARVLQNRALLRAELGGANAVFLNQVHGCDVLTLDAHTPDGLAADAAVTAVPSLACLMMVADCLPVLFCDTAGTTVAAAHAGWRGLAAGVLENTLQALCRQAHCAPDQVLAWLGPCIGAQAFEVGDEVRHAFVQSCANDAAHFLPHHTPTKFWANLSGLATDRLQRAGVTHLTGNDGSDAWCTVTQSSRFFSFRRDGVTGRFAACIWRDG